MAIERDSTARDLEAVFRQHYSRVTRLIARITHDPGRAEELAVEVFLRWPGAAGAAGDDRAIGGWLTRTAIRLALDEVRRRNRHGRFAGLVGRLLAPRDADEIARAKDERTQVLDVLSRLKLRDAELLTLKAEGLSHDELAATLALHPASVGKLVSRAQEAFRKEYEKRHGKAS